MPDSACADTYGALRQDVTQLYAGRGLRCADALRRRGRVARAVGDALWVFKQNIEQKTRQVTRKYVGALFHITHSLRRESLKKSYTRPVLALPDLLLCIACQMGLPMEEGTVSCGYRNEIKMARLH